MQYVLVSENKPENLSSIITEMLKDGWELHGSPFAACTENEWYHYQAMIRRDT